MAFTSGKTEGLETNIINCRFFKNVLGDPKCSINRFKIGTDIGLKIMVRTIGTGIPYYPWIT